jgi:hypothetical protein
VLAGRLNRAAAASPHPDASRSHFFWGSAPILVAAIVIAAAWMTPTSGPAVRIRWNQSVDPARRVSLEERLRLVNRTYLGGTRWGYIAADPGRTSAAMLGAVAGAEEVELGPPIIRMMGPFAIQSFICLLLAVLMFIGALAPTRRWRQAYFLVACALFLAGWTSVVLPVRASHELGFWMGDYGTYTEDRGHFQSYFGYEVVRFQHHMGGFVLNAIDRALGATPSSIQTSFIIASWLAGAVFLIGAFVIVRLEGWSAHAMRYLSLSMAAPLMLSFFGYRELGYLSLSVLAFPLLLRGLVTNDRVKSSSLVGIAGAIQGLRSALHGFGLVGLSGSIAAALASRGSLRTRWTRLSTVVVWGVAAYLIWIPVYVIVLGLDVVPGHAGGIAFRSLTEPYAAEGRVVAPVLSLRGIRDIGLESIVAGVPLLLLGCLIRTPAEHRRIALAFSAVSVAFLIVFWPVQGIGIDADLVFAAFPAIFAGAWLCAHSARATAIGLMLLAAGHGVFWFVIRHFEFVNPRA